MCRIFLYRFTELICKDIPLSITGTCSNTCYHTINNGALKSKTQAHPQYTAGPHPTKKHPKLKILKTLSNLSYIVYTLWAYHTLESMHVSMESMRIFPRFVVEIYIYIFACSTPPCIPAGERQKTKEGSPSKITISRYNAMQCNASKPVVPSRKTNRCISTMVGFWAYA